jgi:hypothetical protein
MFDILMAFNDFLWHYSCLIPIFWFCYWLSFGKVIANFFHLTQVANNPILTTRTCAR